MIYKTFNSSRDYGCKDQIQRATVSIMNNIAERFERRSDNEFRKGLYIAKTSCAEVRSVVYLAFELNMINELQFEAIKDLNLETSRILSGLIKSFKVEQN